ncbi:alpha/beta hydrolase-fold protein [Paraglaciecola aquimarina]|uniref:Alpha/beta hydrolase-fold protein n=1 Tax=Paraglaciecola aquimarina TaxID=1235557 RepID=A0ABU3SY87_9ALTE|nr:alpha/beta hydrolase-fold protein [Paraglaciecola aquimarina]MDU0354882.1 alpha/beta hydrolase-fold protein [Paraglaciecola aquimarina]
MKREYHCWWSPRLQRDMEMLVFGHSGARVLVFPTRFARFYEYEDLRILEQIRGKVEAGQMQLFCVDSVDLESVYCGGASPYWRIQRHIQYEEYILNEVYPFMDQLNSHPCTISHGCSLGGFHAANIAFRHPHLFNKLCVFSGRFDLTLQVEYFSDLFSGFYNDDIYFHTPSHFILRLSLPAEIRAIEKYGYCISDRSRRSFFRQ